MNSINYILSQLPPLAKIEIMEHPANNAWFSASVKRGNFSTSGTLSKTSTEDEVKGFFTDLILDFNRKCPLDYKKDQ